MEFIKKHRLFCLLALILLVGFLSVTKLIKDYGLDQLAKAKNLKASNIPFQREDCYPINHTEIKFLQNNKDIRAVVRYNDSYFAATGAGLLELSTAGEPIRRFTTLDGLKENDLLSLAVFNSKLYIGTRSQGLLTFNGERFERYQWMDRRALSITSLLVDSGSLLIGTFAGGLIEFDGNRFREVKVGAEKTKLSKINYLARYGHHLYVGTFNDGLWVKAAEHWLHFTTENGLLSNRIVGIAEDHGLLLVGSDFGLSSTSLSTLTLEKSGAQIFQKKIPLPTLSSLIHYGDFLLLSKDNGELFIKRYKSSEALENTSWKRVENLSGCRLLALDNSFWLISNNGIWRTGMDHIGSSSKIALNLSPWGQLGNPMLSSNVISALAFDVGGRLWVGNFREGIDVLHANGNVIHKQSDVTREINAIITDPSTKSIFVATSKGMVKYDQHLREDYITKSDGLMSNSILHLAIPEAKFSKHTDGVPNYFVMATSRGLNIGEPGNFRGLTTVQGLPSNSVYSVCRNGRSIYVGTLSGLVEIESGKVIRIFNDSNSKLTHNWITAICKAGQRLFIGTYGGGIFELKPSGQLLNVSSEIGNSSVNPNAIYTDGDYLYAGTLSGAVVFDLNAQKWQTLISELPSSSVLSITGNEKYVYFGTTSGIAQIEKSYIKNIKS
jgi:ligand-binding sensor domain-containing protein